MTRSRDFGIPSFEPMCEYYGVSGDIDKIAVYGDSAVDAYIGGLFQRRPLTSQVGGLFNATIIRTFTGIRDGDAYWFENEGVLREETRKRVMQTSLGDVIGLNYGEKKRDVFRIGQISSVLSREVKVEWNVAKRTKVTATCASKGFFILIQLVCNWLWHFNAHCHTHGCGTC